MLSKRGPGKLPNFDYSLYSGRLRCPHFSIVFIMVTNFVLSVSYSAVLFNRGTYFCQFGGPLACSVFLVVLSIAGENHLQTVWRVCFGVGIILPLTVLFFRLRMLSSKLYRKGAIKSDHDPPLFLQALLLIHWNSFQRECHTTWS